MPDVPCSRGIMGVSIQAPAKPAAIGDAQDFPAIVVITDRRRDAKPIPIALAEDGLDLGGKRGAEVRIVCL
jgi:hypothetical protein